MKLTNRQKYDYFDIDFRELKLINVGHAIWRLYKRELARFGPSAYETMALLQACETVWKVKKELREELKAEREVRNAALRLRMAKHD